VWREYCAEVPTEDPPPKGTPNPISSWKALGPTEKQRAYLKKKGRAVPATRGEASAQIGALIRAEDGRRARTDTVYGYADDTYDDYLQPRDFGDL